MGWDEAYRQMQSRRVQNMALMAVGIGTAIAASAAMNSVVAKVVRDINHPMNRAKEAPRSIKPKFKKGRK